MAWFAPHVFTNVVKYQPGFEYLDASYHFLTNTRDVLRGAPLGVDSKLLLSDIPKAAKLVSRHKTLPNFFHVGPPLCVDQTFRALIEELEPDVHQFVPVELYRTRSERFSGSYYILNICQLIDCLVPEKSPRLHNVIKPGPQGGRYGYWEWHGPGPHLECSIRTDLVAGRHLWRIPQVVSEIFFSDELREAMKVNRIKQVDQFLRASEV